MFRQPHKKFVGDFSEDELIASFFAPIAWDLNDDVAALELPEDQLLLVSTDILQEGIHFVRESPAPLIAQKALRINVSDILASGGRPRWFTLAISMPRDLEVRWLDQFSVGLKTAMEVTGMELIGGDTTASTDKITISITAMGHVHPDRRASRSGARPGDWLGVTGTLGNSGVGLEVVLGKYELEPIEKWYWLECHFCPPFLGQFAQGLAGQSLITAMMDLSDGLFNDLPRLCRASRVGAQLELERVPLAEEAVKLGLTADGAVRGGEDYQLLFSADPANWSDIQEMASWAGTTVTHIGSVTSSCEIAWLRNGLKIPFDPPTWKHFG